MLLGLGLNFLELSLDGGIALIGAILIEAQAGHTEGLSLGVPSDNVSALALPANELVAFLGGNGGNFVLLAANFLLVALEDNRACTVIGERTLVRGNGEGHVEVLLRSSRLLNLLELSSQGNIASGSIAIVESRVGVREIDSTGIQNALAIAGPSPTSELIAFVSGDHVLQTFDLAISVQMFVGQGLSFLVFGEVTGFGIAQVDVNGNFLLDLRLLSLGKAYTRPGSFCQIIKVNGIIAIQIADTIAAVIRFPVVVIRQLRSTLIRRCSNVIVLN